MPSPIEGVRVISMAEQFPGPYCTLLLADLGADVVLVERPEAGDPSRGPAGMSTFFASLNRNKRSVTADMKSDAGREIVRRLASRADVFVEGFRPGVCERLGIGYEALRAANPGIVYASITGFGQTGPYRDRPAHDLSYQAMTGMLAPLIPEGEFGHRMAVAVGDLSSGMFAALGIMAALIAKGRTGEGQYVDVSITDGLLSWMTPALSAQISAGDSPLAVGIAEPAHDVFECADGKYMSLSLAFEDRFWRNLCGAIGREDLAGIRALERRSRRAELREALASALRGKSRDEWSLLLARADVPSGPVQDLREVLADPHFNERGMFAEIEAGGARAMVVNHPLRFSATEASLRRPAPRLGEHTDEVLREAGFSAEEIEKMRAAGSV